jgi:hypothetical protein
VVSLLACSGRLLTVKEIVAAVPVGQSTVSEHLRQLAAVGFVPLQCRCYQRVDARRALMVKRMLPRPCDAFPIAGRMHRWFPAVVTGRPISVSKMPSSCKNLVGATGFEPVTPRL